MQYIYVQYSAISGRQVFLVTKSTAVSICSFVVSRCDRVMMHCMFFDA